MRLEEAMSSIEARLAATLGGLEICGRDDGCTLACGAEKAEGGLLTGLDVSGVGPRSSLSRVTGSRGT